MRNISEFIGALFISICLLHFVMLLSCSNQLLPPEHSIDDSDIPQDDDPLAWDPIVNKCGGTYTIDLPFTPHTSMDTIHAWATLRCGDSSICTSHELVAVRDSSIGEFSKEQLSIRFQATEVPERNYSLHIFFTSSEQLLFDEASAMATGGPYNIVIDYSVLIGEYCIEPILLGDSIYFIADSVHIENPFPGQPSYFWAIRTDTTALAVSGSDRFDIRNSFGKLHERMIRLNENAFFPCYLHKNDGWRFNAI